MTRLDMVRAAVDELGEAATADQVVHLVADWFRTEIGARFVPVYRATLRAEVELVRARERAAAILASDEAARRAGRTRPGRSASVHGRVRGRPRPGSGRSGG